MSELAELLDRVRAATGPDKEIDFAITQLVDPGAIRYSSAHLHYTSSLDAIVSLIDRRLPGIWDISLDACDDGWFCWIENPHDAKAHSDGTASTRPLALCAAFLRAMIAASPDKGEGG